MVSAQRMHTEDLEVVIASLRNTIDEALITDNEIFQSFNVPDGLHDIASAIRELSESITRLATVIINK